MPETVATEEQAEPQAEAQAPADEARAEVRPADLPEAAEKTVTVPGGQLDILLDAAMEVTVQLGSVALPVRELIQLGPGSVLKLDKRAGEPVDVLLRGIKFAAGRLVVVGEQIGVKIEEIRSVDEAEER